MKVPETLGQKIDHFLNSIFRKEQILEKYQEITKKKQAKNLVHDKIYYKIV
jgi:hypothetical protein